MKLGLGEPYEKVQYLPVKIRAYIDLTKPASSVGVGLGYFIGSLFFFMYEGLKFEWFTIFYVSLTMFLAHSASQALNMSEDADMDAVTPHKMNRPIPSGIVSVEEARALATLLGLFAMGRAYMVNWRFGIFVTVLLFMGVFYSLEPLRVKETILTIPWQAVSRGLLVFPAIWAAYGNPMAPEAWALGGFLFFYVLAFQNSADIIDKDVDEQFGIKTWVVELGVRNVVSISIILTLFMVFWIEVMIVAGVLEQRFIYLLSILPLCIYMIMSMWTSPESVSKTTGNHPSWLWYYAGLVSIITIPLIVEVLHA